MLMLATLIPSDLLRVKTRIQGSENDGDKSTSASSSLTPAQRRKTNMVSLLLRIWKREGLAGFFKGFTANMINTFSMCESLGDAIRAYVASCSSSLLLIAFAYFFFHTSLRALVLKRLNRAAIAKGSKAAVTQLSTASELLLGALAGAFAQIFTIPVAVIATRQQMNDSEGSKSPSLLETAKEILEEDGVTGLWKGLKPGLVLTVNPAITYGVFERVKGTMLAAQVLAGDDSGRLTPLKSFALGVLSKTLATVATYPYIFAKVRLQARKTTSSSSSVNGSAATGVVGGDNDKTSYAEVAKHEAAHESQAHFATKEDIEANTHEGQSGGSEAVVDKLPAVVQRKPDTTSAIQILKETYARRGFAGWYQGMQAQILKAVLSQGESRSDDN